uniref:Aldehyde dehydrogenase domain-containing protein n=1 Tax=Tolypothrix bouteillei VB521301 TaxID=1479485 RepID=A0A0C1QMX3_9CYAN
MNTQVSIADLIARQREFFKTGTTKDVDFRLKQLKVLKQAIGENQEAILQALKADLGKPEFEAYGMEIFPRILGLSCSLESQLKCQVTVNVKVWFLRLNLSQNLAKYYN